VLKRPPHSQAHFLNAKGNLRSVQANPASSRI
jgi:hypothetical protein